MNLFDRLYWQASKNKIGFHLRLAIAEGRWRLFRMLNRGASFGEFYATDVARAIKRGAGHPTLGKRRMTDDPCAPRVMTEEELRQWGREFFEDIRAAGLEVHHLCVDYGCGSLRVGQHLIAYLESGKYWGLDVTDRFYRDGLDMLPPGLTEEKKPQLRVITPELLDELRHKQPDFIVCTSVVMHIPPAELDAFFKRLLRLRAPHTRIYISFVHAERSLRTFSKSWAYPVAKIRRLIERHASGVQVDFHAAPLNQVRRGRKFAHAYAVISPSPSSR